MRRTMSVRDEYFDWLCELVNMNQCGKTYYKLMKNLFGKKFYSIVEHDENRASDGLELREEFSNEYGYDEEFYICGECSLLEMIIGVARRMDFETADPYDEYSDDKTSYWFWEMIKNLGLLEYDDESYAELRGDIYVDAITDDLLDRRYCPNGVGGLFPLRSGHENQKKVEIWYQMSAYLNENHAG